MKLFKALKKIKKKYLVLAGIGGVFVLVILSIFLILHFDQKTVSNNSTESSTEPTTELISEAIRLEKIEAAKPAEAVATEVAKNYSTSAKTEPKTGYYIEVNRSQNVVMVYTSDGTLAKVFVASTGAVGSETIVGTFTVGTRYESLFLVGNVWGRYAVQINGRYYFHSVPYFTKGEPWNNLEYIEYNKLGQGASAGCVRLAVRDAKWIYDNIPAGTTVKIYDSDTLPAGVAKPAAIKIDESSPNRGWDPTDFSAENPWK